MLIVILGVMVKDWRSRND